MQQKVIAMPKYIQVKKLIENIIKSERYNEDDKLPSEYELADRFGVSYLTLRQAVGELCREGYLERIHGRGTFLRRKSPLESSRRILFYLPSGKISFYASILRGMQENSAEKNFDLMVFHREEEKKHIFKYIATTRNRRLDGLACLVPINKSDVELIRNHQPDMKLMLVNARVTDSDEYSYVMSDNVKGGYIATQYMCKLGHSKIAFIGVNFSHPTYNDSQRLEGYKRALKDARIPFRKELVLKGGGLFQHGYETIKASVRTRDFTAILAINDLLALGAIKALKEYGIKVPADVSVIGFENFDESQYLDVPLTTVDVDATRMGRTAINGLIDMIEGRKKVFKAITPVRLLERESCAKRRAS